MRHDLFIDRKSIHVNLDKDVHLALREKLLQHGLSMQELFHTLAEMILEDNSRSQKIMEVAAKKKFLRQINRRRGEARQIGELDSDALYSLLESAEGSDDKQGSEE